MRTLSAIARSALDNLAACYADKPKKPSFISYSQPYLEALQCLTHCNESYIHDSGDSIVCYALSNLTGWRGFFAEATKAELKAHITAVNADPNYWEKQP